MKLQALLGYWAGTANEAALTLAPKRLADEICPETGLVVWTQTLYARALGQCARRQPGRRRARRAGARESRRGAQGQLLDDRDRGAVPDHARLGRVREGQSRRGRHGGRERAIVASPRRACCPRASSTGTCCSPPAVPRRRWPSTRNRSCASRTAIGACSARARRRRRRATATRRACTSRSSPRWQGRACAPPSCRRSGSTWRKTKRSEERSTIGSPPSSPSKRYRDTPLARAGPPRAHRHNLGIRHWRTNKDEPTNKNAARTGSRTAWISYLEAANRRCPELKGGILRSRRQPDSGARRGSRAPWSCGAGPARLRESGTRFSVPAPEKEIGRAHAGTPATEVPRRPSPAGKKKTPHTTTTQPQ